MQDGELHSAQGGVRAIEAAADSYRYLRDQGAPPRVAIVQAVPTRHSPYPITPAELQYHLTCEEKYAEIYGAWMEHWNNRGGIPVVPVPGEPAAQGIEGGPIPPTQFRWGTQTVELEPIPWKLLEAVLA